MKINLGIDELLGRKLSGNLTGEEQDAIDRWIQSSPKNRKEYEQLDAIMHSRLSVPTYIHAQELGKKIWLEGTGLTTSLEKRQKTRGLDHSFLKIAATFLAFVLALGIVYFFIGRQAALTSADPTHTSRLVHKSNALGQKSRIVLPDRTVVWLNSESDLQYPEDFHTGERVVTLRGEAFFNVAVDTLSPFRVRVDNLTVTALGTQFNISSFETDPETDIALIEGVVKIEGNEFNGNSILLSPGQGLSCTKQDLSVHKYHFNQFEAATIMGWKDGLLVFDGSGFDEFLSSIRRWYGVEIRVQGLPEKEWNLHGVYDNEYLNNVLESVSYKKNFTYMLTEKTVTIKF